MGAGGRKASSKWDSSGKKLRRCYYPGNSRLVASFWDATLAQSILFFFSPRKYAEKMSFQSDLINDRKWLTASLLLFQMEKRGERNCLLYLVKIHTQPCITDPLLWLLSKISRLAVTLLSSLAKLQPLDISYCH